MAGPMQMWAADTVHNWAAYLTAPMVLLLLYHLVPSKIGTDCRDLLSGVMLRSTGVSLDLRMDGYDGYHELDVPMVYGCDGSAYTRFTLVNGATPTRLHYRGASMNHLAALCHTLDGLQLAEVPTTAGFHGPGVERDRSLAALGLPVMWLKYASLLLSHCWSPGAGWCTPTLRSTTATAYDLYQAGRS